MSRGDVQHNPGEESATKRREAIAFTGKALAAALQPAVFETIDRLGIDNYRRKVDNKLITAHQEVSQALAERYRSADPRSVLTLPAVRDLDDQLRLLSIS